MSGNNNQVSLYQLITKFKETIIFLLQKWIVISAFVLLGSVLGLLKSILSEENYVSKLSFVIEEEAGGAGNLASIASSFGLGMPSEGFFNTANIIDFLKMRSMVESALLKNIDLKSKKTFAQTYIDAYNLKDEWQDDPKLKKIEFRINENRSNFGLKKDSILGVLYKRLIEEGELRVNQPNAENSIIDIEVTSQSEIFSKNFSEALINVAGNFYINSKIKKLKSNVLLMQRQLDSIRNELISSMTGAANLTDNVFNLNPSMNVKRVPSIRKQVDVQVNSAIHAELIKNLEITKFNLMNQTPSIEIIDKPVLPLEIKSLRKSVGIIVGGLIFGILCATYLIGKRFIANLNRE